MKVTLVGPVFPYRGGIAHYTTMLAREFARHHEVTIVNFNRMYPGLLFPGKTQFDESDSPLRIESERWIDSINPVSWLRTGRRISRQRPDLVVFQWWQPFFAPSFRTITSQLRRRGIPVVFLCHNVLPHESSFVDKTLSRIGLGGTRHFQVQSRQDGERLRELRGDVAVSFNPHPIYDFFDQGAHTRASARQLLQLDGKVVLFFGYVRPYKGLGVLLDAFATFRQRHTDATLLIVGEFYEDRQPYDDQMASLGITQSVRVVDEYVPNEAVEAYFRASDVTVLPYLSATQSGIIQTAYSFHQPVIVTAVGGLPDVVEDDRTGFVVPPQDPVALAGALDRFFSDSRAEEMGAAVEAGLDRFSWARCVQSLLEVAGLENAHLRP